LRVAGAKALGALGGAEAATALVTALSDPQWEVRSMAAKALARAGDDSAAEPLHGCLADPAWWVRYNAAQALYVLGGRGLSLLRAASEHHTDAFARDISRQTLEEHHGPARPTEATWA